MRSSSQPRDAAQWLRRVEATARDLDRRIRRTYLTHAAGDQTVLTEGFSSLTFSFGGEFAEPPVVTVTGGNGYHITIGVISTSGFTAVAWTPGGDLVTPGVSIRCLWHALPATV